MFFLVNYFIYIHDLVSWRIYSLVGWLIDWLFKYLDVKGIPILDIQGGPKRTERHTSGNDAIKWLVSVDRVSFAEKNDTKISNFG